jgi:hypothetical protein
MRILEECINAWPMQEMRAQIDALREAFSADKDKPFELKPSFPYGTPSDSYQPSPPMEPQYHRLQMSEQESFNQQGSQSYPLQTMTPPISAVSQDSGFDSPLPPQNRGVAPVSNNPSHPVTNYPSSYPQQIAPAVDESQWNPTPIFHQWNTAFSIPQAALAPPPNVISTSPPTSYPVMPQQSGTPISPSNSNPYMTQYPASAGVSITSAPQQQQQQQQTSQTVKSGYPTTFVSSKQFQQSVASVFDPDGLKRRWTYDDVENQPPKRLR